MVVLNWRLSLVIFLTVPFVTLATRYFGQKIRHLSKDIQDELANSTAVAEDALGAVRLVKAFVREDYEVNRYKDAVEKLFVTARRKVVLTQFFWSGVGIMFMSTLVIIFWYGGKEVLAERLTAGDLVAFIIYALNISRSISQTSRLYTAVNTAAGASERIFELLEETPEIENDRNAEVLSSVNGEVEVEDLWFSYEGNKEVLKGISFKVEAGKTVALVGPSGAGKTTLLNLIPRFYDPETGAIYVDGKNIQHVTFKSLRNHISIVPQEVHLFGTTIRENIMYGKLDATEQEVIQAAKDANAHDFILLLDEATSSLDSESEAQVQEALGRLMKDRTTFVIAHRLSTVQHADQILVLDEGEIVERGSHLELIEQNGLYSHLYELQFRDLDQPERMV